MPHTQFSMSTISKQSLNKCFLFCRSADVGSLDNLRVTIDWITPSVKGNSGFVFPCDKGNNSEQDVSKLQNNYSVSLAQFPKQSKAIVGLVIKDMNYENVPVVKSIASGEICHTKIQAKWFSGQERLSVKIS